MGSRQHGCKSTATAILRRVSSGEDATCRPLKNIDLAVVCKEDEADNGFVSTSNGNIGSVNDDRFREIGLWALVAFSARVSPA